MVVVVVAVVGAAVVAEAEEEQSQQLDRSRKQQHDRLCNLFCDYGVSPCKPTEFPKPPVCKTDSSL